VRIAGAAALLALGLVALGASADANPDAFTLGVVRRDGLMLPFASFDGHHWESPWPGLGPVGGRSSSSLTLPITVSDVPAKWWGATRADAPWTAWTLDGATRPLKLETPVETRVFCHSELMIATDYRGGAFDPQSPTVPKDALATAGAARITPIVTVSTLGPDTPGLIQTITPEFNKEEERAVHGFTDWRDPFTPDQRKTIPIEIEAIYRDPGSNPSPDGAWRTTYVEAIRKYPPRPEDKGCGLITFVRGWIIERAGKAPTIDLGARVTYCDRDQVSFMLPFGRVSAAGNLYWIYQMSSWTDEFYIVARERPNGVRPTVAAEGGACVRRRM
jgi:hypothetical protein